jgi:hypothetical protein
MAHELCRADEADHLDAPRRDWAIQAGPRPNLQYHLVYKRYFLEAGVPIGIDGDPTELSFYTVSTESAVGSDPMLVHTRLFGSPCPRHLTGTTARAFPHRGTGAALPSRES